VLSGTAVVPVIVAGVELCPRLAVVPHWNQTLVERPFGFTVPLNVPPVLLIEVAAEVVTVGAVPATATVKANVLELTAPGFITVTVQVPTALASLKLGSTS
jgi:hypothetical protein